MDHLDPSETSEKDAPLRYDIRLLGRILGDTVRTQEGEERDQPFVQIADKTAQQRCREGGRLDRRNQLRRSGPP